MDILAMMEIMKQARIDNAGNLTIGELLKKIQKFDDDTPFHFTSGGKFDGTYDSYRGYYEDMALGFCEEDMGFNTVGKLKEVLTKALADGVMYGYKGGEYSINENTLLWVGLYGQSGGDMIVEVANINGELLIVTKEDEW